MSRRPARDHCDVYGNFLARLHRDVLHFAVLQQNLAAFIQREPGRKLVPVFRDQNLDARVPKLFFIRCRQEDYVAIQPRVRALQRDERRQIRRQHPLVVDRTAAV